jgi:hypothetical protein
MYSFMGVGFEFLICNNIGAASNQDEQSGRNQF